MKIIVLAQENDNHTAPIKWALERGGYQVACWGGVSWTEEQQVSLLLDEQPHIALGPHAVEAGDRVWIRRLDQPINNPKVSEADRKFAELEYRSFHNCVAYMLETMPVWCINKFSASRFINNKSVQLLLARNCGLKVPKALMSNSPRAVKDFFDHNPNRAICKAFTPHVWQRQNVGGVAVTETFELTREQLPEDEILTYAPGIYQDMVVKQFDIRTVLMGHRIYSYALHNPKKALDWRQDAGQGNIEVEIVATPPEVESGIMAFAKKAGICFGSMDFAVGANGEWWFLEINEQGQFLWLDQFNPQAKIQEKFCAFITAPEGSTQRLEDREDEFPPFGEYVKLQEKLQENQEPPTEIPAAAATSPYMSQEP
jgi:glutathione synthase/RimK-type ligase-like ATP-grasp enzyme